MTKSVVEVVAALRAPIEWERCVCAFSQLLILVQASLASCSILTHAPHTLARAQRRARQSRPGRTGGPNKEGIPLCERGGRQGSSHLLWAPAAACPCDARSFDDLSGSLPDGSPRQTVPKEVLNSIRKNGVALKVRQRAAGLGWGPAARALCKAANPLAFHLRRARSSRRWTRRTPTHRASTCSSASELGGVPREAAPPCSASARPVFFSRSSRSCMGMARHASPPYVVLPSLPTHTATGSWTCTSTWCTGSPSRASRTDTTGSTSSSSGAALAPGAGTVLLVGFAQCGGKALSLLRELLLRASGRGTHCTLRPWDPRRATACSENTEGEYSGLEHEAVEGVVESLKVSS